MSAKPYPVRTIVWISLLFGIVAVCLTAFHHWRNSVRLQRQSAVHQTAVDSIKSAYSNAAVALNANNEAKFRANMNEMVVAMGQLNSLQDQQLPTYNGLELEGFSRCINGLQRLHDLVLLGQAKEPISIPGIDQCSKNAPATSH